MKHPLPIRSYRKGSPESLVNCMVEAKPADALGKVSIIRAPGIRGLADLGGVGRGLSLFLGQLYALVDDTLFNVGTVSGSSTGVASIPGSARVTMAATVDRLCVVANTDAYLFDGTTITQITDADFRPAGQVDFINQYLIFTEWQTARWFSSDLNAPEDYTSTMFATAEHQPDNLVGIKADHGQVFLAGDTTCEIWGSIDTAGFPWQQVQNGVIELGCAAGASLAKLDNSIFWLANDGSVRRLSGFTPVRVSTHGIEEIIRGWGDASEAYGMAYSYGGHLVYVLTKKNHGTVAYDATTNEWHERASYGYAYWRVVDIASYNDLVYLLDDAGRVGVMDGTVYTEFGDTQRVEFTCDPIYAEGRRVVLRSAELMVKTQ